MVDSVKTIAVLVVLFLALPVGLKRPVPAAIRELYGSESLITARDIDHATRERINSFSPLHRSRLIDTKQWLGFDLVPIATTDVGDPIYLRPGSNEADVIYVTHHDGGDTEVLAPSADDWLAVLRRSSRPGYGAFDNGVAIRPATKTRKHEINWYLLVS